MKKMRNLSLNNNGVDLEQAGAQPLLPSQRPLSHKIQAGGKKRASDPTRVELTSAALSSPEQP